MTKASELRDQSVESLEAKLEELREELFKIRNEKVATKKLEKPSDLRAVRRDIARTLTIINEKQNKQG